MSKEQPPHANRYHPQAIEARWQARWAAEQRGTINLDRAARPFYNLMEFPYPSGAGLHIGHVFSFGGADTYGRFMRRQGYAVFQPIGYDAFGIHSENYALKIGAHPQSLTPRAIERFRQQLGRLGAAFDWSRELSTTDPAYYRWTQWIFTQLFKAGLAYRAEAAVNWCPACKTVLANEQVIGGRCERCDTPMAQRQMTQWFFRITAYAERLLDFSHVDFAPAVIARQRAWIGRSAGAELEFSVLSAEFLVNHTTPSATQSSAAIQHSTLNTQHSAIMVFTTRPETLPDATFIAVAPEHPLVAAAIAAGGPQAGALRAFAEATRGRLELERQQGQPHGAFTGLYARHPISGAPLPIWAADYVLAGYGSGAIMGVPLHDRRDAQFAAAYGLPTTAAHSGGPAEFRPVVRYRLRDWLISRQRYWGPPIPIVYCAACGTLPVPDEQLPVLLPPLENFRPTGSGLAPLALAEGWASTSCPQCGGPARRETDVSDNFLDSAWYFMRYTAAERADVAWDVARLRRWLPVSMYTGGPEHATMHHLYARFIGMALYDLGLSPIEEPFARLRLHGTIIRDGRKMSKSRGNVVNPDEYIARYGADATRMALLFLGPFDEDADIAGFDRRVAGMLRFLGRVWGLCGQAAAGGTTADCLLPTADYIRRVTEGLAERRFHTAIAALMEYANWLAEAQGGLALAQARTARRTLVLLLAPLAPHLAEELWERLGGSGSIHDQPWPTPPEPASEAMVELPVQVNGRLRARIQVPADADEPAIRAAALATPQVQAAIGAGAVQRVVVVRRRVVNIVVG